MSEVYHGTATLSIIYQSGLCQNIWPKKRKMRKRNKGITAEKGIYAEKFIREDKDYPSLIEVQGFVFW